MNCKNEYDEDLSGVLALSKDVDKQVIPILIKIFKREKIQDCLVFLSQYQNLSQVELEIQQLENSLLFEKEQLLNAERMILIGLQMFLNIKDQEFNEQNFSIDEYEEIKKRSVHKNILSQEDYIITKIFSSPYSLR
ncbi:unnamed protein product (macronuclear) [Paramecium tetraurelia]|uniref:Uncharacterized protein n=1 Tax=Paramecium tetraurelia TaxID=5888 RepID=A0CFJ8_PARTE|nr:uncharacterized protein GSPATT00038005001 [Paramecium tetraurelia]CAK69565.1 unnamed protein product [Paramecium tetraurelia]|eukprot:XP_001436962.1 hypothetical protein (macronuclear) [Paramecium tetraurelia strain d4-2]